MKRYIEILIGGKRYRFLIDDELDKELKSSLKERYRFNSNNTLIMDDDISVSYKEKQLILKSIIKQISSYDLTPELQKRIDSLKSYLGSRSTIYNSDITKLESILGEASQIYGSVKSSLPKKEKAQEKREQLENDIAQIQEETKKADYENDRVSDTTSSTSDKIEEFKEIIEEISYYEELKDSIPVNDINDAIDRVIICDSMEEFLDKTGNDLEAYDVQSAIKDKNEKIILPPNTKIEDVTAEILKTCIHDQKVMDKVITYVSRKATFQSKTNDAFESLRSSLKVSGLTSRNLNYFGDQFFDTFERICSESGISFESMFKDYFNNYSANKKYNSPMDKFIRLFNKYNGGDDNTRALLEAMLVKKAISRNLISRKYNNYLKEEYRSLNVNSNGYVNFNKTSFETNASVNVTNSTQKEASIATEINAQMGENSHGYERDINYTLGGGTSTSSNDFVSTPEYPTVNSKNLSLNPEVQSETNIHGTQHGITAEELKVEVNTHEESKGVKAPIVVGAAKTPKIVASSGVSENGFRKNGILEQQIANDYMSEDATDQSGIEDNSLDEETSGADQTDEQKKATSDVTSENSGADAETSVDDTDPIEGAKEEAKNALKQEAKKKIKQAIIKFIAAHPVAVAVILGVIVLLLIILAIFAGSSDSSTGNVGNIGYMDSTCDFNQTKVTVTNCYQDINDKKEIANLDLEEYIIGVVYAYTKGKSYSDEALKSAMIAIKTNAFSYGGYNNKDKELELKSCSVNLNYCDPKTGCSLINEGYYPNVLTYDTYDSDIEDSISPASNTNKLSSLYKDIENYIYISESYKGQINSLSVANVLDFDESVLNEFETLAKKGYKFKEILNDTYKENNVTEDNAPVINNEAIFIGDSRTHGMVLNNVVESDKTVYGTGLGYNWFIGDGSFTNYTTNASNGAITKANSIIPDNSSVNIVIWLGANDYRSGAQRYFDKFVELADGDWSKHTLYIVSVGPVDDAKTKYAKNDGINKFNSDMKEFIENSGKSNIKYIDLELSSSDIKYYDKEGLHYGKSDYQNIYNIMIQKIGNQMSSNKKLYNLSEFCMRYDITANVSYWWPVGSRQATSGNIYGGDPVSVGITSSFGPRIDPITNKKSEGGHSGIDIGGVGIMTPVIATKSGKVVTALKGCVEGVQDCGFTYGNHIKIKHDEEIESLYAHLSQVLVNVGDEVVQGQIIGYTGNTGRSTGPHLHFEIRLKGTRVDPLNYVSQLNPRPGSSFILASVDDTGSTPKENKVIICKSLLNSGYSKDAVAGMLVNIQAEGYFKTNNLENCYEENKCCTTKKGNRYGFCMHPEIKGFGSDEGYTNGVDSGAYPKDKFVNDRAGYGLIQWTSSGRKSALYDYAKNENKSISALSVQLGYLLKEIDGYSMTKKYVTGSYTSSVVATAFCKDFERPGGSSRDMNVSDSCTTRANNNAQKMLDFVNNGCSE